MERHIKWRSNGVYTCIVKPETMRFLDFARLQLGEGQQYAAMTGEREYVMDIFSGAASLTVEGPNGSKKEFNRIGGRDCVFTGAPVMVYVPPASRYTVTANSEKFDAGIFSAPSKSNAPATLLEGPSVVRNEVGRDNWRRAVYTALGENLSADRLIAGETLNPPGNWSSFPPHKHDYANPPAEAVLEEIYFFRLRPSQGYGLIWTYTAPGDPDGFSTVFMIEDGDTVLLPKGYHPVVAAPGYELHYTWALAGEERRYGAWTEDPRHAWVKGQKTAGRRQPAGSPRTS